MEDALLELSANLASKGLPTNLTSPADVEKLVPHIKAAIDSAKLWQYYVFDVQASAKAVAASLDAGSEKKWQGAPVVDKSIGELSHVAKDTPDFIQNYKSYSKRFGTTVDADAAAGFIKAAYPHESSVDLASKWGKVLDVLNVDLYEECNDDLKAAQEGVVGRLTFNRIDAHGPKMGEITKENPIVELYFTRLPANEKTAKHPKAATAIANNGWMWAADPLKNFAEYPSKAYLRRQVIVWGDCVKLRYGNGPEDNPWLWKQMISYAETLAGVFDGFRLDNCHSTPLHVGKAIIDAGRRVNPNLYVMAELFTGSQEMDLKFVRELGINSLVREAYNGDDVKNFSGL